MPRRDLKVVGNHLSRCNNSSPRYARENHYAILARMKISYVFKSQDKHNASYFSKCHELTDANPTAKIRKIYGILTIWRGDPGRFWAKATTFDSVGPRRAKCLEAST